MHSHRSAVIRRGKFPSYRARVRTAWASGSGRVKKSCRRYFNWWQFVFYIKTILQKKNWIIIAVTKSSGEKKFFVQAQQSKPCIIFFDEVDGLAPVRSNRQDVVHSSVVSTLLALMDGLDNNSEIIVIGATNRLDAIDPALRRPGRFDRELYFPLPCYMARKDILSVLFFRILFRSKSNVIEWTKKATRREQKSKNSSHWIEFLTFSCKKKNVLTRRLFK